VHKRSVSYLDTHTGWRLLFKMNKWLLVHNQLFHNFRNVSMCKVVVLAVDSLPAESYHGITRRNWMIVSAVCTAQSVHHVIIGSA
jgi:hypothetical protein